MWLGPPLSRSGSGLNNNYFLKDSSPLGDRTKYATQSMPQRQTCVTMKKCIMMSKMRHSERGSAISDCLVVIIIISGQQSHVPSRHTSMTSQVVYGGLLY